MEKKPNPFAYRSMAWALYEEDWSDLTLEQIAEVFDSTKASVINCTNRIYKMTGYRVPYTRAHRRRKSDEH